MFSDFAAPCQGDPITRQGPSAGQALRFAIVLSAHLGLLWGGLELAARPEVHEAVADLMVRLIETPPEVATELPAPPVPQPARVERALPPPVLTAAPEAAAAPQFVVPTPVPAPPAIEAPPVAAAPVVTAARFDADYLSNPKPVYPAASRRLGEEGKVILRVHVSADGAALAVEIKQSCGFGRLDEAARAAVERWRFVPARRGAEPVDSWVAVPIVFSLLST